MPCDLSHLPDSRLWLCGNSGAMPKFSFPKLIGIGRYCPTVICQYDTREIHDARFTVHSPVAARPHVAPWIHVPEPQQAEATRSLADIGALKISYWDTGGTGEVSFSLTPECQAARASPTSSRVLAAAGYRVIAWSRRGTEETPRGSEDDPSTAAADRRALLDALGISEVSSHSVTPRARRWHAFRARESGARRLRGVGSRTSLRR